MKKQNKTVAVLLSTSLIVGAIGTATLPVYADSLSTTNTYGTLARITLPSRGNTLTRVDQPTRGDTSNVEDKETEIAISYSATSFSVMQNEALAITASTSTDISRALVDIQWFKVTPDRSGKPEMTAVKGATSLTLDVPTATPGTSVYKCVILPKTDSNVKFVYSSAEAVIVTVTEATTPSADTEYKTDHDYVVWGTYIPDDKSDTDASSVAGTYTDGEQSNTDGSTVVGTYTDVAADSWYASDVEYVSKLSLMNGVETSNFKPMGTADRAMIVTVLWRLDGTPAATQSLAFNDVDTDAWYAAAVSWASEKGIVNGYGDGSFKPNAKVTREQVAAILHRYAKYKGFEEKPADNVTVTNTYSEWAKNNVLFAKACGMLDAIGSDISDLRLEATRSEIAAFLARFCKAFGIGENA